MVPFDSDFIDFIGGCANWKTGFQEIPPHFAPEVCMMHGRLGGWLQRTVVILLRCTIGLCNSSKLFQGACSKKKSVFPRRRG